jgi:hypothetical protein
VRTGLAIATVVVAAGLTYGRLFYGIDFTDEAFYVAVPYRFVLGAQPLVDETNIAQQTPALLLVPFVALWHWLVGVDGIVLYARHLHYLFTAGVAAAVFVSLRRLLGDAPSSAVYATAAVAFVPFGIHGLSYNTFASGFFTAGCFLGAAWSLRQERWLLVGAGCAHGLAIFTYPTFAVPVICWFALLYAVTHPRSLRSLVPGLVSAAAATLATVAFFMHRGVGTINDLVDQTTEFGEQGGGLGELSDVVSFCWSSFAHKELAAALLIVAAIALRWRPALTVFPLTLLPLAALPADLRTSASANTYVTCFALLAPFAFLLVRGSDVGRRVLLLAWVPGAAAGVVTALSSANGPINVAIGFFPGLVATAVVLGLALRPVTAADFAPAAVLLSVGVALQYLSVYRDAGITNLTTAVGDGPYAGIFTTQAKHDFLTALDRDVTATTGDRCRIVFYDAFPAGYLLGHGRPATNATWLLDVESAKKARYEGLLLDYYDRDGGLPDVAVRLDRFPLTGSSMIEQTYAEDEPLERAFGDAGYATARATGDYRIMRARRSTCLAR